MDFCKLRNRRARVGPVEISTSCYVMVKKRALSEGEIAPMFQMFTSSFKPACCTSYTRCLLIQM